MANAANDWPTGLRGEVCILSDHVTPRRVAGGADSHVMLNLKKIQETHASNVKII